MTPIAASKLRRSRRKRGPARRHKNPVRRLVIVGAGWTFMVLGVLGLFLPILQGVLFLAIGLILLSSVSPRVRLLRQRLCKRYPALSRHLEAARVWLKKRFAEKPKKTAA